MADQLTVEQERAEVERCWKAQFSIGPLACVVYWEEYPGDRGSKCDPGIQATRRTRRRLEDVLLNLRRGWKL
jgi:hypothetical protein